jgi:hypothetical protein
MLVAGIASDFEVHVFREAQFLHQPVVTMAFLAFQEYIEGHQPVPRITNQCEFETTIKDVRGQHPGSHLDGVVLLEAVTSIIPMASQLAQDPVEQGQLRLVTVRFQGAFDVRAAGLADMNIQKIVLF